MSMGRTDRKNLLGMEQSVRITMVVRVITDLVFRHSVVTEEGSEIGVVC